MPSSQWVSHAYPLQQITVSVQGTRHCDRESLASLLRTVADRIERGDIHGEDHDDDFGYRFSLDPASPGPSFFDTGAGGA